MNLKYKKYWEKGKIFFNVEVPILCGAMTWISDSKLVQAVSDAGALGFLAAGNMSAEELDKEIKTLKDNNANFGVNLITIAPNYNEQLKKVVEHRVKHIVFAGSFPRKNEVEFAKSKGAKVLCFASTKSIAQRMINYGADALILEGSEAGGHIGHVSTIVLLQQVLFDFSEKINIFVAGGIASGRMVAHLLLMGAAGVQMGTIFAMSKESPAHELFKKKYKRARAREAIATPRYDSALPVVSVRALINRGTKDFGKLQLKLLKELKENKVTRKQAQYKVEEYWAGALRKAVQEGDIKHGSLMAGQSVGLINSIKPVKEIIENIVSEAEQTFDYIFSKNKS